MIRVLSNRSLLILAGIYSLLLWVYSITSYVLTDPNLILISNPLFIRFQQYMWSFTEDTRALTVYFGSLFIMLWIVYVFLIRRIQSLEKNSSILLTFSQKEAWLYGLLFVLPLLFAMNAFSHDVFNYIFNAKMVSVYGANPHIDVALKFQNDAWTRFMHNTHTPAPYGYAWTIFSLIPFGLGFSFFSLTYVWFKVVMATGIFLLYTSLKELATSFSVKISGTSFALLFLNPLFLIETVGNVHNDIWMMALGVYALSMVKKTSSLNRIVLSAGILVFSIFIKYVTAALLPLWFYLVIRQKVGDTLTQLVSRRLQISLSTAAALFKKVRQSRASIVFTLLSILFFIPLLTARSQQFHPWYLLWALTWLPFIQTKWWKTTLVVVSLSSLLRYLPWLYYGNYSEVVITTQKLITWVPFFLTAVLSIVYWQDAYEKRQFS